MYGHGVTMERHTMTIFFAAKVSRLTSIDDESS
jgi:hypothetical protein